MNNDNKNDIAVIGIGCRLPDALNYSQFWTNLIHERNSIKEITADRWSTEKYYSKDNNIPNTSISKWCGLIDGFDSFDNLFFNVSNREAANMDPQQRLLMEETWHCIEDSGVSLEELQKTVTSVYIGAMAIDYHQIISSTEVVDSYACLGNYECILANRLSHFLGLKGVSISIDAACASSLASIHLARQSLLTGESDFALAGGVSLDFHPWKYIAFSKSRMLSVDGQCKTFDKNANGYVPGEGVGIVLLRRYEDAVNDNNHIYALIKSSAINHCGNVGSITAPSIDAQRDLIKKVYNLAGVSPEFTTYVEAHGTGTSLGDPIEVEALRQAFQSFTGKNKYCHIGSVKSNIGHLEAAAGVAGVIKILMMLKYRKIPRTLNIEEINPIINFEESPFVPAQESVEWKPISPGAPLRASVSSFGMGGANSHLLIEENVSAVKKLFPTLNQMIPNQKHVFLLSAKTKKSLANLISEWKSFVTSSDFPKYKLTDICAVLAVGREAFLYRVGNSVKNKDDIKKFLYTLENEALNKCDTDVRWIAEIGECEFKKYADLSFLAKYDVFLEHVTKLLNNSIYSSSGIDLITIFKSSDWEIYTKYFNLISQLSFLYSLSDLGIKISQISGSGTGFLVSLVFSGILELQSAERYIFQKIQIEKNLLKKPKIALKNPIDGKIVKRFEINRNYLLKIILESSIDPYLVKCCVEKAKMIFTSQWTFKKFVEEWDSCLKKYSISTKDILGSSSKFSEFFYNEKDQRLIFVILRSSINRLYKKWSLCDDMSLQDTKTVDLINLIVNGILLKEEFVELSYNQNADIDSVVNSINNRLERIEEENYPYLMSIPYEFYDHSFVADGLLSLNFNSSSAANFFKFKLDNKDQNTAKEIIFSETQQLDLMSICNDFWLFGSNINWEKFYNKEKFSKLPLPVYKFEKKRIWLENIKDKKTESVGNITSNRCQFKEIPDKNNLNRIYTKSDLIISEHIIAGKAIIPGAVLIEQCLNSILERDIRHVTLKNIVFQKPGIVEPQCCIKCFFDFDNNEIKLDDDKKNICKVEYAYAQGNMIPSEEIDLNQLSCESIGNIKKIYKSLASAGYEYGEGLQVIKSIHNIQSDGKDIIFYVKDIINDEGIVTGVSPRLLDGLFQCVLIAFQAKFTNCLQSFSIKEITHFFIPYYIKLISLNDKLWKEAYVRINIDEIKMKNNDLYANIYAFDKNGKSVLYIENMIFKLFKTKITEQITTSDFGSIDKNIKLFKPEWIVAEIEKSVINVKNFSAILIVFNNSCLKNDYELFKQNYSFVCEVEIGDSYSKLSETRYLINSESEDDFLSVFGEIKSKVNDSEVHIFFDTTDHNNSIKKEIRDNKNIQMLFCTVKGLMNAKYSQKIQVIIAVNDTFGISKRCYCNNFTSGAFLGFAEAVGKESPKIQITIVDFESSTSIEEKKTLLIAETSNEKFNHVVGYRDNKRFLQIFRKLEFDYNFNNDLFSDNDVYLVVGGSGGIGFEIIKQISKIKNVHFIIVGRSTLSNEKKKNLEIIKQLGSHPIYIKADITKQENIDQIGKILKEKYKGLNGVIHSGGILDDSLIYNKKWSSFQNVIRPKIQGLYLLNELTKNENLNFFIAFSSIVSIIGNFGQIDYATGNSFIDSFIDFRSRNKFPGKSISINWPLWKNIGMGDNERAINQLSKMGLEPLTAEEGCKIFFSILKYNSHRFIISKGTKNEILERADLSLTKSNTNIKNRMFEVTKEDNSMISDKIKMVLSEVLGISNNEIDTTIDMREYGVDSIAIGEILEKLGNIFQADFPPSLIIENPSIEKLAKCINGNIKVPSDLKSNATGDRENFENNRFKNDNAESQDNSIFEFQKNIKENIIIVLSDILSIPQNEIDISNDVREYGVDSIAIGEILDKLGEKYNESFPPSIIIENPSVDKLTVSLADFLLKQGNATLKVTCNNPENLNRNVVKNHPLVQDAIIIESDKKNYIKDINSHDYIAVIGMAGRMPGSSNLDIFWKNLKRKKLLTSKVPPYRFNLNPFFDSKMGLVGKTYVSDAGLLDDVACFDAKYFKINEDDAIEMDPQQRIFLEVTQELFDNAGYKKEELKGRNIGMFIGGHESNYGRKITSRFKYQGRNGVTNVIPNLIIGRAMDYYDLFGPSFMVYTACSSSLVALHNACRYLQFGECEMAIAGGIELLLDEEWFIGFSSSKVLSPDGKCKVFDKTANGFVLGEGVGAVLLKPLSTALKDGDTILGVIRGSAITNDGMTMGLTTPNIKSQETVIEKAITNANIDPSTISYYEAHGTGTFLGDPIEIKAATRIYKKYTDKKMYCGVGSVKSNIGHLLSAAGIASFLKVLLSIQNKEIPATINLNEPHPRYDFENSPFFPILKLIPWEADVRRAGISSFGFGGTNCHLILEELDTKKYNYIPLRKSLPKTKFNRKRFWIGKESIDEYSLYLRDVLSDLKSKNISLEAAKRKLENMSVVN